MKNNDFKKAGEYLYLKQNKSVEENHAVSLFEKSLNYDAFQILRRQVKIRNLQEQFLFDLETNELILRTFKAEEYLEKSKLDIKNLISKINKPNEINSNLVQTIKVVYDELEKPFYLKFFEREKDFIYNILILTSGFLLNYLI